MRTLDDQEWHLAQEMPTSRTEFNTEFELKIKEPN
jgi:hypothetical protein